MKRLNFFRCGFKAHIISFLPFRVNIVFAANDTLTDQGAVMPCFYDRVLALAFMAVPFSDKLASLFFRVAIKAVH
jgi:hypothetical protein